MHAEIFDWPHPLFGHTCAKLLCMQLFRGRKILLISLLLILELYTVEPLNADTFGTRPKCPVYRGVHISGVPRNVDTWGIGQNVQYIGVSSR